MAPRTWRAVAWIAAAAAWPATAAAQPTADDAALAETLFQDARALVEQKDWARACPKFAESQRLDPRLGTLLNLATCHEQQGKTASAWAEFSDAAARAERAGQKERADLARERARALEKRLSRVVLSIASPVEGMEVWLDGRVLGAATAGSALPLDPGDHAVEVRAPGRVAWRSRLQVAPGPSSMTVEVPPLAPAPAGAATPGTGTLPGSSTVAQRDPAPAGSGGSMRTAGWVLGGVGLAGIGIGTVFGVRAVSLESDADDTCPERACPDAASVELHDDARTSAHVSTIALATGVGALGAGVVLLLLADDDPAMTVGITSATGGGGALQASYRW
jgi:hypothetical protein